MEKIIAGNFQTSVQADKAARALKRAGFPESDVFVYANNPPGQHGEHPLGGDENADPGSDKAAGGAAAGGLAGAAAGAAVGGAVGGALGAVAGAGVGAYAGSFGGAMKKLGTSGEGETLERRPAGTMVAVRLGDTANREAAIEKLSAEKPVAIEEADGEWVDGEWVDFDPVAKPKVVWPTS